MIFGTSVGVIMLIILLLSSSAEATAFEQWNRTFGGVEDDMGFSVWQISDGGYIISAYTKSYGIGGYNTWLVKTDADGNEQWSKTLGYGLAYSVQQTSDSGYILTGGTAYGENVNSDVLLIKTDVEGNLQWNKTFGGKGYDVAYSVQQTSDSGYIITGFATSFKGVDALLIKTDSNGKMLWDKTIGNGVAGAYSVQQTSDSGYILAGNIMESAFYGYGMWLIKTDSKGKQQWNKRFDYVDNDVAFSVQQTSDGGYILVGNTESYGVYDYDMWLIKTDSNGNEQWNKTFGGKGFEEGFSVWQTSDNGYIIAGSTNSYGAGEGDAWLVKTDSNGNEQWNKTFGGISNDELRSVQQTLDGGYIATGFAKSFGDGGSDVWLLKVSSDAPLKTIPAEISTALVSPTPTSVDAAVMVTTIIPSEITPIPAVAPTEKISGFEVVLAIATLSAFYMFGRKRW